MNKKRALKKIESLKAEQTSCRFDLLHSVLTYFDFECTQPSGGSSHYKYRRPGYYIIVPFARPVKEIYVKKIIAILEEIISESE